MERCNNVTIVTMRAWSETIGNGRINQDIRAGDPVFMVTRHGQKMGVATSVPDKNHPDIDWYFVGVSLKHHSFESIRKKNDSVYGHPGGYIIEVIVSGLVTIDNWSGKLVDPFTFIEYKDVTTNKVRQHKGIRFVPEMQEAANPGKLKKCMISLCQAKNNAKFTALIVK